MMQAGEKGDEVREPDTRNGSRLPPPMTGAEIDAMLDRLDEEAYFEELELERELAEIRRMPWWMFGFSTLVP